MTQVCPALVGVALHADVVSRSIRIGRTSGLTSFADVMMVMTKAGVDPEEVETVARGPPEAEGWRLPSHRWKF